jgi:DNA-binding FadR family transcriptional regulator
VPRGGRRATDDTLTPAVGSAKAANYADDIGGSHGALVAAIADADVAAARRALQRLSAAVDALALLLHVPVPGTARRTIHDGLDD